MEYQKNDVLQVIIEDIGNGGEGIGKVDGFTLFVKDAVIGDTVEARITKAKKSYAYARLEKVIVPSPFRVEPRCPLHRQCGGCQIQALSYEKQLEWKQKKVNNHLMRIGGFEEELIERIMEKPIGMQEPYRYRNKAQFPIGYDREGRLIAGFYAGRTHHIVANTDCALGVEENKEILEKILHFMEKYDIPAYDEEDGTGLIRHVLIRKGFHTGQLMVCLVIHGRKLPHADKLVETISSIKNMTSVSLNYNTDNTNVILGKEGEVLWGSAVIEDTIRELVADVQTGTFTESGRSVSFCISPQSFYQVNPAQTEKLYSLALDYACLSGTETVWDLYCGIGTISLFLAGHAGKVYGVEIVPQAIEDAKENARINGIENAEFLVGKVEEVLPDFYEERSRIAVDDAMLHPDVIVVDPPRKGCDEKCLATMLQMSPERIVYVSCDSATLARDLRTLCDGGYELKRGRVVDQFGQTVHVETVCLLSNRKSKPDSYVDLSINMEDYHRIKNEEK